MFKFRPQRGGLAEAMRECVELPDAAALEAHLGAKVVYIKKYGGIDTRNGWETHVVVTHDGPVGFIDRHVEGLPCRV